MAVKMGKERGRESEGGRERERESFRAMNVALTPSFKLISF